MERGNKPLQIEPVRSEDLQTLCQLSRQTFSEAFEKLNDPEPFHAYLDQAFAPEQLRKEFDDPYSQFFFATIQGEPVGYIKLLTERQAPGGDVRKSMEIQRIYVLEAFIGQKVGKALMEKALEIAQRESVELLWLGVWEENPKAIHFYEKWGFQVIGSKDFELGEEIQRDLLMMKKMSPSL